MNILYKYEFFNIKQEIVIIYIQYQEFQESWFLILNLDVKLCNDYDISLSFIKHEMIWIMIIYQFSN